MMAPPGQADDPEQAGVCNLYDLLFCLSSDMS